MFIDDLIRELEIMRDNARVRKTSVTPDDVRRLLDTGPDKRHTNHDGMIDARMADDLRKLVYNVAAFRLACVQFSAQRYMNFDPKDPDRFRRTRKQVIETGRDIMLNMSHIEPEIR